MIVIISIVLCLVIILFIERSYRVYRLKKTVDEQDAELSTHKNKREEFAISMAKSKQAPQNTHIDPLSHLLSESAFDSQYTHLLNQSKRFNNLFAVLMIDIDHFGKVNEDLSRSIGDNLLIEVGKRLKNTLRDVDILSRYEGDIFVGLLPNMLKPEVIVHAVERIMQSLTVPFELNGHMIELTACTGIAIYPFDGEDKNTLLMHAKEALQKAKANGKNVFQFYQEETQALGKRELNLKSAIKDTDFLRYVFLEYKPYYNTLNNEVVCIEVVASLNHPDLGKVDFAELARVSRYTSKMFDLYEWMMKTAVSQCGQANNKAFQMCPLIFKFSLKQFETKFFVERMIEIINKNTSSNQIVLELTDGNETANLEAYRDSILSFNDAKVPLAVGVLALGHFALNKLNHVHFSYLKIDEKLVQDIAHRQESKVILERILSLVDNLKIDTLMEGVDTEEQKQILQSMGCSVMQGKNFKEYIVF